MLNTLHTHVISNESGAFNTRQIVYLPTISRTVFDLICIPTSELLAGSSKKHNKSPYILYIMNKKFINDYVFHNKINECLCRRIKGIIIYFGG